jgi:hypothetical protein
MTPLRLKKSRCNMLTLAMLLAIRPHLMPAQSGGARSAGQTPKGSQSKSISSPVPADVQAAVDRLLKCVRTTCGKRTFYTVPDVAPRPFRDPPLGPSFTTFEFNQPGVRILPWKITDAERLNRFEWNGQIILTASAYRLAASGEDGEWGDTSPGPGGTYDRIIAVPKEFYSFHGSKVGGVWHWYYRETQGPDREFDPALAASSNLAPCFTAPGTR